MFPQLYIVHPTLPPLLKLLWRFTGGNGEPVFVSGVISPGACFNANGVALLNGIGLIILNRSAQLLNIFVRYARFDEHFIGWIRHVLM